jgi:acylphosphatase
MAACIRAVKRQIVTMLTGGAGPMDTDRKAVLVTVRGRVQGVGFRVWTLREAQALGLSGWVRNEADGSVRALLEGPQECIERMLDRLRNGPPGASVREVSCEASPPVNAEGFQITR